MTDAVNDTKWDWDHYGVCLKKGLAKITDSYDIKYRRHGVDEQVDIIRDGSYLKRKYDVIFRCSSDYSIAIILDNRQYHSESNMKRMIS